MTLTQRRRLQWIAVMVIGISLTIGLVLFALRENVSLFYTPTQVLAGEAPAGRTIRVGGIVVQQSIKRGTKNLDVTFELSDTANEITVHYTGTLPDLFKEGQGIVAQGKVTADNEFIAKQVLAKHDENYMPPEVKESLSRAKIKQFSKSER